MTTALIVEDSPTDVEILTSCLQKAGMTIIIARSGEEGLAKLNSHKPDLIILDVVLPGTSGFEVCRELKKRADTQKIPVLICSTKGTDMDKFWGLKQGADAYLPKPFDQDEMLRTVKQLLIS